MNCTRGVRPSQKVRRDSKQSSGAVVCKRCNGVGFIEKTSGPIAFRKKACTCQKLQQGGMW